MGLCQAFSDFPRRRPARLFSVWFIVPVSLVLQDVNTVYHTDAKSSSDLGIM